MRAMRALRRLACQGHRADSLASARRPHRFDLAPPAARGCAAVPGAPPVTGTSPLSSTSHFSVTGLPSTSATCEEHLTQHVLMVTPRGFRSNDETLEDNKFMADKVKETDEEISEKVMAEWKGLVEALESSGVHVTVIEAQNLPDEVFPNNWFSTHSDGTFVVYPMKVPSRAKEVRHDVISNVRHEFGLSMPVFDLSGWKDSGVALEGTGSLVLDRTQKVAYMAVSKRADKNLANLWARKMGYELVAFHTADRDGEEIYHTNVLMSVGWNFAVVCLEVIPCEEERLTLLSSLKAANKVIVTVSLSQMEDFACNCIQLQADKGTVFVISAAGWNALEETQRQVLESCVDRVIAAPVPTIEKIGGGSVRCMIAELFHAKQERKIQRNTLSNVESEYGRLEMVIVHEPGLEVDSVMPWTLDPMKVDDCFNRVDLKAQHRNFSNLLRSRGAQVMHVKDLLTEISEQGEDAKRELFRAVWGEEATNKLSFRNLHVDNLVTGYSRRPLEFDVPPLMNLFFMRDPIFSVPGGWAVIARPFYTVRQMESKLMRAIFKLHPGLRGVNVYDGLAEDPEVFIEGGDVLVADAETVLVGISQRTNELGADRLAEFLFRETPVTRVVKVFIPKQRAFMHLDTLLTFVDQGKVLTMPYFWSKPEVYAEVARRANTLNAKMGSVPFLDEEEWIREPPRIEMLIKGEAKPKKYRHAMSGLQAEGIVDKALFVCGPEGSWPSEEEHVARALTEQWNDAANVFCISPGTVVAYKWCTRTVTHLQDSGIDVVELDGVELMKGRGGARCMTFPLRRTPTFGL